MWVKRVFRSHNSFIITLPKQACRMMGLRLGDHLMIEYKPKKRSLTMYKVVSGDKGCITVGHGKIRAGRSAGSKGEDQDAGSKSSTDHGHNGRSQRP